MSRAIKFRAWDKDSKAYRYKFLMPSETNENSDEWTCPLTWNEDEKKWVNNDQLIFEQYTGLKDKNGIEIYEGDVIKDETKR